MDCGAARAVGRWTTVTPCGDSMAIPREHRRISGGAQAVPAPPGFRIPAVAAESAAFPLRAGVLRADGGGGDRFCRLNGVAFHAPDFYECCLEPARETGMSEGSRPR